MQKIELNIPTAEEAARKVQMGEYTKALKQAEIVSMKINGAIEDGQRSIGLYEFCLEPSVKAELERHGYTVKFSSFIDESNTTISW